MGVQLSERLRGAALLPAIERAEFVRRDGHPAAADRPAPDRAVPARLARRDRAALPWLPTFFLPALGIVVVLVYAFAFYRLLRRDSFLKPDGRLLVVGMALLFCGLFIVSRFNIDPTGRYFLPLALPLGIVLARWSRRRKRRWRGSRWSCW
ncbi:MAG: hypothetical protein U0521_13580 [Anaerolineae bacterium]